MKEREREKKGDRKRHKEIQRDKRNRASEKEGERKKRRRDREEECLGESVWMYLAGCRRPEFKATRILQ